MRNKFILNKIINKIVKLIKNIDDFSSEEIAQKLLSISYTFKELEIYNSKVRDAIVEILSDYADMPMILKDFDTSTTLFLVEIILEDIASSIKGILSDTSISRLEEILNKIHAFMKGFEIFLSVLEDGYIDELFSEIYEPFVDVESGEIIEEPNTSIKDAIFPVLAKYASEESIKISEFSSECAPVFYSCIIDLISLKKLFFDNLRQKLSDGFEGYTNKPRAQGKDIHRQLKSSELFFSPQKNTHPKAIEISNIMFQNRTGARNYKEAIKTDNVPARHIITASFSAIKRVTEGNKIVASWESIKNGKTVTTWQNKPSDNNLGNLFVMGVGRYGEYDSKAILSLLTKTLDDMEERAVKRSIDKLSKDKEFTIFYLNFLRKKLRCECEKKLVKLMIEFSRDGKAIDVTDFDLKDTKKNKGFVDRLNRLIFLTSFAEIWRYMYTTKSMVDKKNVEKIAFANAHARVLQLIQDGELSMQDVFDEDADFGLPTGKQITKNTPKVIEKFIQVNELYNKKELIDYDESALEFLKRFPEGGIASFRKTHVTELKEVFDKDYKILNDQVDSSDDETDSYGYS